MSDDVNDSQHAYASIGSSALIGGVACCLGIKLLGGIAILGGLGAPLGLSTGLMFFIIGGVVGVALAILGIAYRRSDFDLPGITG